MRVAARVGVREVDTEHLYLGLLALGGAAARLLGSHGVTLAAHAIRSGDSHGGGSSINLSGGDRT